MEYNYTDSFNSISCIVNYNLLALALQVVLFTDSEFINYTFIDLKQDVCGHMNIYMLLIIYNMYTIPTIEAI